MQSLSLKNGAYIVTDINPTNTGHKILLSRRVTLLTEVQQQKEEDESQIYKKKIIFTQ